MSQIDDAMSKLSDQMPTIVKDNRGHYLEL